MNLHKSNKDPGAADFSSEDWKAMEDFFNQKGYIEQQQPKSSYDPIESIPRARNGGDMQVYENANNTRPYEYMSDIERDKIVKDVLGEDAIPLEDYLKEVEGGKPSPTEKSQWLEIMRRLGK